MIIGVKKPISIKNGQTILISTKKKVLANVLDEKILLEELRKTDYIIHLAAEMDLNPEFKKFMDVNVGDTALIYELIVKHNINIKKVIVTFFTVCLW